MSDLQSPALSNSPILVSPPGSPPYAGFRSAQPEGLSTSTGGPSLSGWPRKIAWNEFRDIGSRPAGESEDAQISVEMSPGKVNIEKENGQFKLGKVTFKMIVKKSESWVVKNQKSDALKAHEQGHYDIAGLFYRDLMTMLGNLRTSSVDDLGSETNRLMAEYDQLADTLSDQYDSLTETNHGLNATRQQVWEKRIQDCIQNGTQLTAPP
ncbi:MAG: DUF922 domain-containing protein [Methylococcales bacterium]